MLDLLLYGKFSTYIRFIYTVCCKMWKCKNVTDINNSQTEFFLNVQPMLDESRLILLNVLFGMNSPSSFTIRFSLLELNFCLKLIKSRGFTSDILYEPIQFP